MDVQINSKRCTVPIKKRKSGKITAESVSTSKLLATDSRFIIQLYRV